MAIRKPRGTQDFLPEQMINWHYIEQRMREICKVYGFNEIRTPAFEDTKLFLRGIGETTDVVQKEMYTFTTGDDGGSSFTLRPENTASAVRAYLIKYMVKKVSQNGIIWALCSVMINRKQAVTVNFTNLVLRY